MAVPGVVFGTAITEQPKGAGLGTLQPQSQPTGNLTGLQASEFIWSGKTWVELID